jgi:hypothetical protein
MQFVYGPVLIKCYGGCRRRGIIVSQIRHPSPTSSPDLRRKGRRDSPSLERRNRTRCSPFPLVNPTKELRGKNPIRGPRTPPSNINSDKFMQSS